MLLLLLTIVCTTQALTFHADIRSVVSSRTLGLRQERALPSLPVGSDVAPLRAKKAPLPFVVKYSNTYEWYLVDAAIGTPPQNFTFIADTGSDILWVCDANSPPSNISRQPYPSVKRHFFRSNDSSTFSSDGRNFSISYGSGTTSGITGFDVFQFGPFQIQKQKFGVTNLLDAALNEMPFDGIFGHGPDLTDQFFNGSTVMGNLLSQLDRKMFTLWYRKQPTIKAGENGGRITYGGFDTENCASRWNFYPVITGFGWSLLVKFRFNFGKYVYEAKTKAIYSDSGDPAIAAPTQAIQPIVLATGAEYDFKNDIYIASCKQRRNLPDLIFTFGEDKYTIPVSELLVDH
ncbi:ASP-1 protein [Aphelenchoides avenae]|nr:ASP-1 protein [Aphelenchus avenae]